jgi:hypothetical protein
MANNDRYDTHSKMRTSNLPNQCPRGGGNGVLLISPEREKDKSTWKGGENK